LVRFSATRSGWSTSDYCAEQAGTVPERQIVEEVRLAVAIHRRAARA
jgi:hypothetical protein